MGIDIGVTSKDEKSRRRAGSNRVEELPPEFINLNLKDCTEVVVARRPLVFPRLTPYPWLGGDFDGVASGQSISLCRKSSSVRAGHKIKNRVTANYFEQEMGINSLFRLCTFMQCKKLNLQINQLQDSRHRTMSSLISSVAWYQSSIVLQNKILTFDQGKTRCIRPGPIKICFR